jgi:8-oxo-dGTP pyrophosphatase MutT (NUDIX family)
METPGRRQGRARHSVSPRTLAFLEREGRWLLLRGGPGKWFAGRLNGIGGHVEPGEAIDAAARREVIEETGLTPLSLDLVAVVHVIAEPAVMLFVHRGTLPAGAPLDSAEGELTWRSTAEVQAGGEEFLPDIALLFAVVLDGLQDGPARCLVLDQSGPDGPRLLA